MNYQEKIKIMPQELREEKSWCLWALENKKGRMTKIPYQIDGHCSSSTDPKKWDWIQSCVQAMDFPDTRPLSKQYSGIGFIFNQFQGLVFIDLDHHLIDGQPDETAKEFLSSFSGTYTEVSQSGTGLHLFVRGSIPYAVKNSKEGVEMYSTGRYCACTFNSYNGSDKITGDSLSLKHLFDRYKTREDQPKEKPIAPAPVSSRDDATIIEKACKSSRLFDDLFHGNWEKHYTDRSKADFVLACNLAYWCDRDPVQIERIFNASGLSTRHKWERDDYRKRTIARACQDTHTTYSEWLDDKRANWSNNVLSNY